MRIKAFTILGVVVLYAALLAVPASDAGAEPGDDRPEPVASASEEEGSATELAPQTSKDDPAPDIALTAESQGWNGQQAAAVHASSEAVEVVARALANKYADQFVGSVIAEQPGEPPEIYVKGVAPAEILELAKQSPVPIKVIDGQPLSFAEVEERSRAVHLALEEAGYEQVSTGFAITARGRIDTGVMTQEGLPSTPEEIGRLLPADLRDDVLISVSDEPIVDDEASFGGMWMRNGGVNTCTSGWSVGNESGARGVVTAGHCLASLDHIAHPGDGAHALDFVASHRGQWGDMEWFETPNVNDIPSFYADSDSVRTVEDIETLAEMSEGEPVCLYGRSSNRRDCSSRIAHLSQQCTNGGVWNGRLVLTDSDVGIPGDSGAPWSYNYTAFGIHKGNCADVPGQEVFTKAVRINDGLGVSVRRQ